MGLFDTYHQEILTYLKQKRREGAVTEFDYRGRTDWPISKNRNLVLAQDTAVELGDPKSASTSFLLWTNDYRSLRHNRITVVGPDLPDITAKQSSFGKIVIVGGEDFNQENSYGRYRALELVRYDLHLKGYMMRGVSQYQREWSRISQKAIEDNFSFHTLGGALIDRFLELDFVRSVEVIFITASRRDVLVMQSVSDRVLQIMRAMNKMAEELSFDCDTCEYAEVCDDVAELRSMRQTLKKREANVHAQSQ
jgi:CO dehydrogenase/acetyl-CoA synthase beta subunit